MLSIAYFDESIKFTSSHNQFPAKDIIKLEKSMKEYVCEPVTAIDDLEQTRYF